MKAHLSRFVSIDPKQLPYDDQVIGRIRSWRDNGGKVALVTTTDQTVARSIADHLGLFDEIHGSENGRNLKGATKAGFLVDRYGAGNYDYIGDAEADIPVWASARKAITVGLQDHAGPSPQPAPTLRKMKATRFHRLLPPRHLAYQKPPRL